MQICHSASDQKAHSFGLKLYQNYKKKSFARHPDCALFVTCTMQLYFTELDAMKAIKGKEGEVSEGCPHSNLYRSRFL